jgi:ribosome-binding factor A
MDAHRTGRVSEAVREELSEIIGFELEDPRLEGLGVTEVHVSSDMRHAHVKVAVEAGKEHPEKALKALEHAASFLRHELATRLSLRKTPELHFTLDQHPEAPARVELLLKRARKTRGIE